MSYLDRFIDTATLLTLVLAVGSALVLVLLWQRKRSGKEISIWFFSALLGLLLGGAAMMAIPRLLGYHLERDTPVFLGDATTTSAPSGGGGGMGGGMMGGGGGAPGGGGGAPGGGGGGGGGGGPQPRRDVVNLVRKIDILTGDIQITLTQEQTNAIRQALAGVEDEMTLSDEAAQAKYDEIAKLLTSEQMKTQSLVELPRLPRDNRLGTPGYSSPSIPEDLNPFTQQEVKEMLSSLRAKLGGSEDIPDATNGDAALDSGATDKSSSNDAGADDDNQQHPE